MMKYFQTVLLLIFAAASIMAKDTAGLYRQKLLNGRTVQIGNDDYYIQRSARSIADELRVNGFDAAWVFVTKPYGANKEVIAELHKQGIAVGAMLLPSWIYLDEQELDALLPSNWRDWLEVYTQPKPHLRVGMVYPEYNTWYKKYIRELLGYGFDGFTFAEVHFANYDGLLKDPVDFGDVSPGFRAAFKQATGLAEFPNFTDRTDPNYFKTNTVLFDRFLQFRTDAVNHFYNDVVNAPDGLRAAYPEIVFATWTLGDSGPNGLENMRVWEGNDVKSMIDLVKPDLHFVQTHWPDWSNPNLPADYAGSYMQFFNAAKAAAPDIKLGMQADFCSLGRIRRTPAYQQEYYHACRELGIDTTTYYIFHLRWEIYNEPPALMECRWENNELRLVFDQFLAEKSAKTMLGRTIESPAGTSRISAVTWDGNTLICKLDRPLVIGEKLNIPLGGIADDPKIRWHYSNIPPFPQGPENRIADGTVGTMTLLGPLY